MKITMISNYINHHQIPFSNALYEKLGDGYHFIQTEPMEEERIRMGWGLEAEKIPYVVFLDKQLELCKQLIDESDILLVGWMEREDLIVERLKSKKLTIRISERLYREGQWKVISPRGLIRKYKEHTSHRKQPVYLLCAGAYVASDFSLVKAYPDKMFRFGYFPEFKEFTKEQLQKMHVWGEKKNQEEIQIVWAGRFIPLKHPELAVALADSLKKQGYRFHLHMVGGGELEGELRQAVKQKGLQQQITFYGFLKPAQVRKVMEKCHIHLFTSNYLEGWGAVVNEAMNSGCVEVANVEVGAAPFLIRHGKNGLVYKDGSYEDMETQVKYLLDYPKKASQMGMAAYETIATQWNAPEAAKRLLKFYEDWKNDRIDLPQEGPFSPAPVIAPRKMYGFMTEGKCE
ncbi:MAG: glycosyltransferase family 4 protein [Lachnospiraceae bacterium]|nr:glycosyltransferase family 4 protein [Lachnospiraceae bacterium]